MHSVLMLGYSAAATLGVALYLPVVAWRRIVRRQPSALLDRLAAPAAVDDRPVWVHAVSVGEVNAVRPLIDALLAEGWPVVVSTTTLTGREVAARHFPGVPIVPFPVDWRWVCRRALDRIHPRLVLLAETELWPNFLAASTEVAPVGLVNARLSDPSMRGYRRIGRLLAPLLARLAFAAVQSERDAERLAELGVPAARLVVTGNLKYDAPLPDPGAWAALHGRVRDVLQAPASPVWLWGSTREGEERQLEPVYRSLRRRWPDLRLIVVPRHPHRADEVESVLKAGSFRILRRSRLDASNGAADILIVDTVGELAGLYGLADVVFVGGSLAELGGQNIVEAAAVGRPVLFGPHMSNFKEVADAFLTAGAAIQVTGTAQLEREVAALLADPEARRLLGERAREVAASNRGAIGRTVICVRQVLDEAQGKPC